MKLLIRIGIVRREEDGSIVWPVHINPWWTWKAQLRMPGNRVGVFRNRPGIVKWIPGRMLPRRWGFHILGFEIGDRGGGRVLVKEEP